MTQIYNTFKNQRGQNIPKTAIIENDIELVNWLKETFPWVYNNVKNNIIETDKYLVVGFSASQMGIIYINVYTANSDFIERFDTNFVKDFTNSVKYFNNDESFKKYVKWAYKLPKRLVNNY